MRKLFFALAVLGVTLCGSACATDGAKKNDTKSFSYLKKWVGKDPTEIPAKNYHNLPPRPALWDDPKIKPNIIKSIGEDRFNQLISGWGYGSPSITYVEKVDDYIVFSACKPKSSCSEAAIVYISTKDGSVQACYGAAWFNASGEAKTIDSENCQYRETSQLRNFLLRYGQ